MKKFRLPIAFVLGIFIALGSLNLLFGDSLKVADQELGAIPCEKVFLHVCKREILEKFFRVFLEESQGGYVLYGNKPVCIEGILPKEENVFMLGGALHKRSVTLKEGLRIWQTLPKGTQKKYLIQSYDALSYGWKELLLINRDEFLKVVRENLPLFQYVLGPKVSPEELFENLIDPHKSFSFVLKNDKVLTGMVLGFGTQNSLHVGREELIDESLSGKEIVPFKSPKRGEFGPGSGSSRLKREQNELNKDIFISNDLVKKDTPDIPWFGCLKNRKTEKLLNGYTKAQKKIREKLNSKDFLGEVFRDIYQDKKQSSEAIRVLSESDSDLKNIPWSPLIARSILQGVPCRDAKWIDWFIQGMQAYEQKNFILHLEHWDHLLDTFEETDKALDSLQNLIESEEIFKSLSKRADLTCLVPQKLYFRTIKQSTGDTLHSSSATIRLEHTISLYSGEILSKVGGIEEDSILNLSDCVSGFAAAIKGMAIGEEREIFIHPAYAYGESCNIAPNSTLVAHVKLLQVIDQSEKVEPSLSELETLATHVSEKELREKHQALRCQIAKELGARTWSHFRRGQSEGYSLNSVVQTLLSSLEKEPTELSSDENDLLTRLHWKIYHL